MRLHRLFVMLLVPGLLAAQTSVAAPAQRSGKAASASHRAVDQAARGARPKQDIRGGARAGAARGPLRATSRAAPATSGARLQPAGPSTPAPASAKDATSSNPIDLRGGLPTPKDAPRNLLHDRVQQIAKQVQALGVKANIAKPAAQTRDAQPAGPSPAGDRPSSIGVPPSHREDARPGDARSRSGAIDAPSVKPAIANPNVGARPFATIPRAFGPATAAPPGHAANAAVINGTGTARTGIGPGTVGGAAKAVAGVNGTAIRAKP